jgi:uncharacterized protein YkwD
MVTTRAVHAGVRLAAAARARRVAAAAAIVAGLALAAPAGASAGGGCPGADAVVGVQDAPALVQPTLCLLNAERAAAGRRPLVEAAQLTGAAVSYSAEMVGAGFFAHRAPGGPDLPGRLSKAGYLSRWTTEWIVGENLAWARASAATPRAIVAQWMASPAHRRNILEPAFRDIGIGVAGGTPGDPAEGVTVTTDFGERSSQAKPPRRLRARRVRERRRRRGALVRRQHRRGRANV